VRGADAQGRAAGRDWLARRLEAAGAAVQTAAVYRRLAPHLGEAARRLAQAALRDGAWWLFSSSEAVANLQAALPGQDWRAARALATHERIAGAARRAGFGRVETVSPRLSQMAASIEFFQ
ncbi:MAG: uroporphyrinogen-III synthase, partial [Xenophilus sp.]